MSGSSSGVKRGWGTTVRIGRGSTPDWTLLVGTEDSPFPDQTPEDVDTTWQGSPGDTEEGIRGMKRLATWPLPLQYVPGSDTDILLTELEEAGSDEKVIIEITPAGGASHRWVGYVNSYRVTSSTAKEKQMAEVVFKVSARLATVPPSAPVNQVAPAISGVAQVGEILTAWPGSWSPTGTLAYQWQVDDGGWENIAGATGQTYTPVVGQIGKPLRVIVTATNNTGSTSEPSAPTADVIAA